MDFRHNWIVTPIALHILRETGAHFYQQGFTWIAAWMSNYIHNKVWDEITYPFPNLNDANR